MCELFSDKNGFGTTVGTETSSSQGQLFGAGFQTEMSINKRQQWETNQVWCNIQSSIINWNEDKKHKVNTVIEACSRSDNHKIVTAYNNNERLIKVGSNLCNSNTIR